MSIIQTTHQDVSAVLKSLVKEKPAVEVEWPAYIDACKHIAGHPAERAEQILNRKRAHALHYLGMTRRFNTAYNKTEPRVFTMEFVSELGQDNAVRRVSRNPWLEAMLQSTGNDGTDRSTMKSGNVLPFGPQIAPYGDTSAKLPS